MADIENVKLPSANQVKLNTIRTGLPGADARFLFPVRQMALARLFLCGYALRVKTKVISWIDKLH